MVILVLRFDHTVCDLLTLSVHITNSHRDWVTLLFSSQFYFATFSCLYDLDLPVFFAAASEILVVYCSYCCVGQTVKATMFGASLLLQTLYVVPNASLRVFLRSY